MKYHKTCDGSWMRCRAEKRAGRGVSQCPIGALAHVIGRQGIADAGGGIETRTENGARINITISPVQENGTFTATSAKNFKRIYKANGTLMTLRERAKSESVRTNKKAATVRTPKPKVFKEQLKFNADNEAILTVAVREYFLKANGNKDTAYSTKTVEINLGNRADPKKAFFGKLKEHNFGYDIKLAGSDRGIWSTIMPEDHERISRFFESQELEIAARNAEQDLLKSIGGSVKQLKKEAITAEYNKSLADGLALGRDRFRQSTEDPTLWASGPSADDTGYRWTLSRHDPITGKVTKLKSDEIYSAVLLDKSLGLALGTSLRGEYFAETSWSERQKISNSHN